MPRIEKIRIVGVKYDRMRKQYGDTLIDLVNEMEPQHTLLTLVNGGGKGLLLQTLFQLLMPLTKWGAKSENRIEALFYNERKQFLPYTFHVVLEWRLDTEPVQWLMTGIAVTAQERSVIAEGEGEAETQYLLYTQTYQKPHVRGIEDLPLFDTEKREGTPFKEWKTYLERYKKEFQTFSRYQTKEYYHLLKSYDIDKNEWEMMREINRQEGGVEAYFKKGQDNFGIFHHLIIPEISRNLDQNDDGKNQSLAALFKDNGLIAQNLPKLLKRESAYQQLLELLQPIEETLKKGMDLTKELENLREKGQLMNQGIRNWKEAQIAERNQWEQDKEQALKQQKELQWQEDNLEYARVHREWMERNKDLDDCTSSLQQAEAKLHENQILQRETHRSVLLHKHKVQNHVLMQIRQQMEEIQKSSEVVDTLQAIERVKAEIRVEWERLEQQWETTIIQLLQYNQAMEQEQSEISRESYELEDRLTDGKSEQKMLSERTKKFNEQALQMANRYGAEVNRQPEKILKGWEMHQLKADEERLALQQLMDQAQQEREELVARKAQLDSNIQHLDIQINETSKMAEERRSNEISLYRQLSIALRHAYDPERFSIELLQAEHKLLLEEIFKLRAELASIEKEYWAHQIDTALGQEDYWIPNQEVVNVKSKLEAQGIKVKSGTEFLKALDQEEVQRIINNFPLFPYGLVLQAAEWKKVNKEALQSLLLRSPVPIYIREQMGAGAEQTSYMLIQNYGVEMVGHAEKWEEWKEALQQKTERFEQRIRQYQAKINEWQTLFQDGEKILSLKNSFVLLGELHQRELELQKMKEVQEQLERQAISLQSKRKEIAQRMEACSKDRDEAVERIKELRAWMERLQAAELDRHQKQTLTLRIQKLEQELANNRKRETAIKVELHAWNRSYDTWVIQRKAEVERIQLVLNDIAFPHPDIGNQAYYDDPEQRKKPFLDQEAANHILKLVANWETLRRTIEQNNAELQRLSMKEEYERKALRSLEEELSKIDTQWTTYAVPEEPLEVLIQRWEAAKMAVEASIQHSRSIREQQIKLTTLIEQMDKQLQHQAVKIRDKHQRSADTWTDVDLTVQQETIRTEIHKNRTILAELSDLIQNINAKIQQLELLIEQLESRQITAGQGLEIPDSVWAEIKSNPKQIVEAWLKQEHQLDRTLQNLNKELFKAREDFRRMLDGQNWDSELLGSVRNTFQGLEWDNYAYAFDIINSIKEFANNELLQLKLDKDKAEDAQNIWTSRAAYRVISIIKQMKQMIGRMTITNANGHRFPMVKMESQFGSLPDKTEDVAPLLRDYFVQTLNDLLNKYENFDQVPEKDLEERMSESKVVHVSLRNRYPTLYIYKPQTTNVFMYERPKGHHYTEWETINRGSLTEAKGSGGQLLAARTIMMMMLMTYRRQMRDHVQWAILISDNPFGQAVSSHILDPIFTISEILHFQWIVLAPPELIKLDVSRRFLVYWELELQKRGNGERIVENLQHGGRAFTESLSLFDL